MRFLGPQSSNPQTLAGLGAVRFAVPGFKASGLQPGEAIQSLIVLVEGMDGLAHVF